LQSLRTLKIVCSIFANFSFLRLKDTSTLFLALLKVCIFTAATAGSRSLEDLRAAQVSSVEFSISSIRRCSSFH